MKRQSSTCRMIFRFSLNQKTGVSPFSSHLYFWSTQCPEIKESKTGCLWHGVHFSPYSWNYGLSVFGRVLNFCRFIIICALCPFLYNQKFTGSYATADFRLSVHWQKSSVFPVWSLPVPPDPYMSGLTFSQYGLNELIHNLIYSFISSTISSSTNFLKLSAFSCFPTILQ